MNRIDAAVVIFRRQQSDGSEVDRCVKKSVTDDFCSEIAAVIR